MAEVDMGIVRPVDMGRTVRNRVIYKPSEHS